MITFCKFSKILRLHYNLLRNLAKNTIFVLPKRKDAGVVELARLESE